MQDVHSPSQEERDSKNARGCFGGEKDEKVDDDYSGQKSAAQVPR